MTIEDQPSGIDLLRAALAQAYRGAAENRYLHRLHCVLLMLRGLSSASVAAWFFHDESTVAGWRRRFARLGTQGLFDQQRTGRPAVLNPEQVAELQRCLRGPPTASGFPTATKWQGKLVAAWLERRYGLCLSLRPCQRLLRDAETIEVPAADNQGRTRPQPPLPAATRDRVRPDRSGSPGATAAWRHGTGRASGEGE